MVLTLVKREVRDLDRNCITDRLEPFRRLHDVVKGGFNPRLHQEEELLEALNFYIKDVEHLLVLAKGNLTLPFASLSPPLYSEEGKKYFFRGGNLEVLANKLERLHKWI